MDRENKQYVYIYLDQRERGEWFYKDLIFTSRPILDLKRGRRLTGGYWKLVPKR